MKMSSRDRRKRETSSASVVDPWEANAHFEIELIDNTLKQRVGKKKTRNAPYDMCNYTGRNIFKFICGI